MNPATSALATGTIVLLTAAAGLAFPSSRLAYTRAAGAEHCPDEEAVRGEVRNRLGYDPFVATSDRTITVVIALDGERLEGRAELVDASGSLRGLREFSTSPDRCDDLVHAIALSISIAIDPASAETGAALQPEKTPPTYAESEPNPVLGQETPGTQGQAIGRELEWEVGLGAFGSVGTAPGPLPRLGGLLSGAVRRRALSLTLELRGELPGAAPSEQREFVSSLVELRMLPCIEMGHGLSACGVASPGRLFLSGPSAEPRAKSGGAWVLGLGARLALEWPISSFLALGWHADLLANLLPVRVESDGVYLWDSSAVSASLGMRVAVHFR